MFGKIKCQRCGEKINKDYSFCPKCGLKINKQEDYGLLGKDDFFGEEIKLPMGFETMFNALLRNLDKQMKNTDSDIQEELKRIEKIPKNKIPKTGGISISISTSGNNPPEIRVKSIGNVPEFKQQENQIKKQIAKVKQKTLTKDRLEKFLKLPREEPKTELKRLSDKVIYEINLPDVKSIDDVSIKQMESSIEIKAIAKDKAYSKIIQVNLPIINYELKDEKLFLELAARN